MVGDGEGGGKMMELKDCSRVPFRPAPISPAPTHPFPKNDPHGPCAISDSPSLRRWGSRRKLSRWICFRLSSRWRSRWSNLVDHRVEHLVGSESVGSDCRQRVRYSEIDGVRDDPAKLLAEIIRDRVADLEPERDRDARALGVTERPVSFLRLHLRLRLRLQLDPGAAPWWRRAGVAASVRHRRCATILQATRLSKLQAHDSPTNQPASQPASPPASQPASHPPSQPRQPSAQRVQQGN